MEKLTILCVPVSGLGHINATVGVANALKKRQHTIVFATERSWQGKFEKFGFQEYVYDERDQKPSAAPGGVWAEHITKMVDLIKLPPIERKYTKGFDDLLEMIKYSDSRMKEIVNTVNPDVIIEDLLLFMPALLTINVPIVKLISANPLVAVKQKSLPPFGYGLPLDDNTEWEMHRRVFHETMNESLQKVNDWYQSQNKNCPVLKDTFLANSTNLNIYMYPKAAAEDYLKKCELGEEWIGVDHCLRESSGNFEIPLQLKNRPGKLIFLSLGSFGSSILELMTRLVAILSNSKHKFIVSKGHNHDKYDLPENMWGEALVPQLDVLPLVDLVITHGGNNTFVESLYFGKPMIVLPLFGDQMDNAQRVVEMNIGRKFFPFSVTEQELNDAIDSLLCDTKMYAKLKEISKEIQESNAMDQVVERIEFVAKHPKFPTVI